MSNDCITLTLRQKLPATPKWVLMVLCNAANDAEGRTCRRSHSLLAEETGLHRVTVVKAVQELITNGRIAAIGRHSDGSTIYKILVSESNPDWQESSLRLPAKQGESSVGLPVEPSSPRLHVAPDYQESSRRLPRKLSTATHNQRNKGKEEKKNAASRTSEADPRFTPFVTHVCQTRPDLVITPRGGKALKELLSRTSGRPIYALEKLFEYWQRFLNSPNKFYREHGDPLRCFCENINSFTDKANGTHSENGGSTQSSIPGSTSSQRTASGDPKYNPKQR